LRVGHGASADELKAAYEARMRELDAALGSAPEAIAQRTLVREAHEVLSDPAQRRFYDEKLREEHLRALARGSEQARAGLRSRIAVEAPTPGSSPLGWMIGIAVLGAVVIGAYWIHTDQQRKAEVVRMEKERLAEQARQREAALQLQQQNVDWAKDRFDKAREAAEERRLEAQRARESQQWRYEQDRLARQQADEERRAAEARRRAEYQQQREEQENLRRAQMQLERDRRLLHELERERGMRF
jgi:curved DNA-binding protein CbpA